MGGEMKTRELIEQAMTLLEKHDDIAGNSRTLDEAYELLQQALDELDANKENDK
jgi:hypothetical protein